MKRLRSDFDHAGDTDGFGKVDDYGRNNDYGDGWNHGNGHGGGHGGDIDPEGLYRTRPDFLACPDPSDLAAALVNAVVRPA